MYSAKIDGEATTFGTSGMLYRSNKVMYDRKTNTLWSSLLGEPVIGPLARRDIKLEIHPVAFTTWSEWVDEHPETKVLSLETGYYDPSAYAPEDSVESFYTDYRADTGTMFPVWERDDRLAAKAEVLGVSVGDVHKAYSIASLNASIVLDDSIGGQDVVIIASAASSDVRVYKRGGQTFRLPPDAAVDGDRPRTLIDDAGGTWTVTDAALVSADGSVSLTRLPSNVYFWFAWFAFHPVTELYEDR